MTIARSRIVAARAAPLFACSALGLLAADPALASTRTSVVVTAGTKVETAPYEDVGSPPVGVAVSVGVMPTVRFDSGTSTVALTGNGRIDQYIEHYGNDISGAVGLAGNTRLSSKTSLSGSLGFQSSRRSYNDRLLSRPDPAVEVEFEPLVPALLADPSLLGTRNRSNTFSASAGLSHVLNARDSVSVAGSYSRGWTDSPLGQDFDQYGGQIGYSRRLSAATSLQLGFAASHSSYSLGAPGTTVLTPSVGISTTLKNRWVLSVSGGASISMVETAPGLTTTRTGFSGSASACRRDERGGFCLNAARAMQPTFLGDVRAQTEFGASYSRRLSARDNISASATYSRTDGSVVSGVRGNAQDVLSGGLGYSRRFSQRLNGFASASLSKLLRASGNRRANFGVNVGVSYVFGGLK